MTEYRCLSVMQPWAELIANRTKGIELRTWSTNYRGPLVIAASKRRSNSGAARRWDHVDGDRGRCVALVELADVRPATKLDAPWACCEPADGEYAWVLRWVRRLSGPPVRGSLGLFRVRVELPR